MGKRGAAARWSQDRPRTIVKPPEPYAHRAAGKLTSETCQVLRSHFGPDVPIPICIIREWVELLERAKAAGDLTLARDVLKALTAMLMPRLPARGSAPASQLDLQLPSDVDFSHLSNDELERATGRRILSN